MFDPVDPRWPRLLSLAVHEFRTPITVVAGYIRMLLKDRAGPVTDQQRRLLEEAEKSCGRLSGLVAEMSELSALEAGTASLKRSTVDLRALLREAVEALPAIPDRDISIDLETDPDSAPVEADGARLRTALTSLISGLRREIVAMPRLVVRESARPLDGRTVSWIVIGEPEQSDRLQAAQPADLGPFDEWRGGCGLSLAIARRVVGAHGGHLWAPVDGAKAAAVVAIPHQ